MKKTVVFFCLLFLTTTIVSNIFASRNLTITEYCGEHGLINRGNDPVLTDDILNIQNDIVQDTNSQANGPERNKILSKGIVINGKGHTLDGNGYGGFIVDRNAFKETGDSDFFNATLTNYGTENPDNAFVFRVNGLSFYLFDVNVINNTSNEAAILLDGTDGGSINVYASKDIYFRGNKNAQGKNVDFSMNNGFLSFYSLAGKNIYVDVITGYGDIKVGNGEQFTGTLVLGGNNEDFERGDISVNGATIKVAAGATYFNNAGAHHFYDGKLDMINNVTERASFRVLYGSEMKFDFDVDLENWKGDELNVESTQIESIVLNKINVISDSQQDKTVVFVIRPGLSDFVTLNDNQKKVFGPIYAYDVAYDLAETDNTPGTVGGKQLIFTRAKSGLMHNPEILQSKVAVAGVSVSQEEVFDTVFNNAGNYSFFQKQGSSAGDVEDRAAPTLWVKTFGSQEDVDLNDYTKIETTYYGAMAGLDFDRQYSDLFDATYGIFASYIGGELKDGDYENKVKQNGGYFGLRANWYIGKLFVNAIADYGVMSNTADTNSDSEDFNAQVIGLAARLGYNFEVINKSFTVQPSVGVTGKYMITDDFDMITNGNIKVHEKIDDISNITVEPGLKLVKNLGKCWILSAEGKYVVEEVNGDIKVNDILLPEMSYDNYANVGLGIEKIWGYTVLHLKGNKTFGGRDGIVLNAGIEFKF